MCDNWQTTIDILQSPDNPIVNKPKLSEKLLVKPPFRFLHDVISEVQRNSGFAPGLYQGQELDAKEITEKDAKVNYLRKMIDVVGIFLGQGIPARPNKIIAGLEPENTNAFLQLLGQACRLGDAADVVQRVLAGEHHAEGAAAPQAAAPRSAAPSPPPPAQAAEPEPAAPVASKPARESSPSGKQRTSGSGSRSKTSTSGGPEEAAPPPAEKPSRAGAPPKAPKAAKAAAPAVEEPPPAPSPPPPAAAEPQAAASPGPGSTAAKFQRPVSARKAPPKIEKGAQPVLGAGIRTGAGARAPKPVDKSSSIVARPVTVFEDGKGMDDDDVEVVHEQAPAAVGARLGAAGDQGALVRDILEAQKGLQKAGADATADQDQEQAGTGIVLKRVAKPTAAGGSSAGRAGDPAAIRELVEKLCRASTPLAKSMDFLQEDLENMRKEYRFWLAEKSMYQNELSSEMRSMGDMDNSQAKVDDLDSQIKQSKDRIIGLKAQILKNDERMFKLLAMATQGR